MCASVSRRLPASEYKWLCLGVKTTPTNRCLDGGEMEHSTPPTLSTASSNTAAMTTLWQRGLQWCRKSKPM